MYPGSGVARGGDRGGSPRAALLGGDGKIPPTLKNLGRYFEGRELFYGKKFL